MDKRRPQVLDFETGGLPKSLKPQIDKAFKEAAILHGQGRLQQAEHLYHFVLAADNGHFEAVYRLGLIRLQQSRFADADAYFQKALNVDRTSADANHHRGIALLGLQRVQEAETCFRSAIAHRPNFAEAHDSLGHALQMLSRPNEAIECHKKAIALKPKLATAHNNLGNALCASSQFEQAIAEYHLALAVRRNYPEVDSNLGRALVKIGKYEEAITHFKRVLAVAPNNVETLLNLGSALGAWGRREEAMSYYRRAFAIDPSNASVHICLAEAFRVLGQKEEADKHCDKAIELDPSSNSVLTDLAFLMAKLNRAEQALSIYDRVLAVKSDLVPELINRASLLQCLGRFDEARATYVKARAVDPADAAAQFGEASLLLQLGDLRAGFEKYEARWDKSDMPSRRSFNRPMWKGEDIAGKTILLHAEQGFGDTLQFCRYAELLAERRARVVLEVQPELQSLLTSVPGVETVIAAGNALPGFDFHCPMASLPLGFGTTLETIPGKTPYLAPPADRIALWEKRLGSRTKPRIGLVWSGNPKQSNDHNRSMRLRELTALLELPDIQVVSLVKGPRQCDLPLLKASPQVLHLGDDLQDFSDTAAVMRHLDVVISVCTSVCHLSGALNKPTWVMLSAAADWRWLLDRTDNPWYPSACLFRQRELGNWGSVVGPLVEKLKKLG
jgi:tetratricopeptide (TPR) repeat protein